MNDRIIFEEVIEKDRGLTSETPSPLSTLDAALTADISAVSKIDAVASILEVICRTTGMGFSAVARVTQDRWVACAVYDEIAFGLRPGGGNRLDPDHERRSPLLSWHAQIMPHARYLRLP